MQIDDIVSKLQSYHPSPDLDLVINAYRFAEKAHKGQVRASGEEYIQHVLETAYLTAKLKLDDVSIAAALLHDTIEDCDVTEEELRDRFGEDVANIVVGVTKLTRIKFESKEEKQAENLRKMLVAMSKDIRVILIKLCDRLHNMRTLSHMSEKHARLKAKETEDIYAPLANRLGIHWLKSELEDLCLLYLRPEMYKLIESCFAQKKIEREHYIEMVSKELREELEANGISATVSGRTKHYYSVWRKMVDHNLSIDEINDLVGFRVIVSTVRGCYEALGVVHAKWKPVPGRFKDYIAMPKPNMYQSLHTTVIGDNGERIEIQIRTVDMHKVAEEGIAAHWLYKENRGQGVQPTFDLQWVRNLVESQEYIRNPDEFLQSVKGELFPNEIFVFTPKGDLLRLPYGSTPVDFAFAVHTDLGFSVSGAKVNGHMVSLSHQLKSGDTVEVITSKNQVPSKDWLDFVKTSKAKQRIRSFLRSRERENALQIGEQLLSKDLRKVKTSLKKLEKQNKLQDVLQKLGYNSKEELLVDIGYGKITTAKVVGAIIPNSENTDIDERLSNKTGVLERLFQHAARVSRSKVGVRVSGIEDMLVRFGKCCEPLPGDRIVGFITRGRGVTVHVANCKEALKCDPMRKVDVYWDVDSMPHRRIKIMVVSQDQMGILANLSGVITSNGANITSAHVQTSADGKAINSFEIMVENAQQLNNILRGLEMVPGVLKVERVRHLVSNVGKLTEGEEHD